VRSVAGEVDLHHPVGRHAEGGDRARVGTSGAPRRGDGDGVVEGPRAVPLEQGTDADGRREAGDARSGLLRVVQPGQRPGHRRRGRHGRAGDVDRRGVPVDRGVGPPAGDAQGPDSRTLRHIAGGEPSAPTTATTAACDDAPRKRRSVPVRWLNTSARSVTTTTWRPLPSSSDRERRRDPLVGIGGDHARSVGAGRVREPAAPVPRRRLGGDHHELHVGRAGPGRQLHDERPGDGGGIGSGDRDGRAGTQVDGHRRVLERRGRRDHGRDVGLERLPTAAVEGDAPVDGAPSDGGPVHVGVTAAAAPDVLAQGGRGGHGTGQIGRRGRVVTPLRVALVRHCRGERVDVAGARRPPAATRPSSRQRRRGPQPDRRGQADAGQDEEQRGAHDDGDDHGTDGGERRGHDAGAAHPCRRGGRFDDRDRGGVPAGHDPRCAAQGPPPRVTGEVGHDRRPERRPLDGSDPHPAGPERQGAAQRPRGAPADRLAVDAARHPARQLDDRRRAVGRDVDHEVVRFQPVVVDADRRSRRAADEWRPGASGTLVPAAGPASQTARTTASDPDRLPVVAAAASVLPRTTPARAMDSWRMTRRPSSSS
jgi:hypothetical protein